MDITETCNRGGVTFSHSAGFSHLNIEAVAPDRSKYIDELAFCRDCNAAFIALLMNDNELLHQCT